MKKESSSIFLLDVNVLLALAWPNHQFHVAAERALGAPGLRWATCALTQLGFIRLSSNPAAIAGARSPQEAAKVLERLTSDAAHIYIEALGAPAGPSCLEAWSVVLGHRQITDAYLLWLARTLGTGLFTFDRRLAALDREGTAVRVLGEN